MWRYLNILIEFGRLFTHPFLFRCFLLRPDFDAIMDDFIEKQEQEKQHVQSKPAFITAALRAAEKQAMEGDHIRLELIEVVEKDPLEERWDCETILTTYSNVENHPRMIRERKKALTERKEERLQVVDEEHQETDEEMLSSIFIEYIQIISNRSESR